MCRVQGYLRHFAASRNLRHQEDAAGNIVIVRPGSGGGEGAHPVIIQGHIDMVTEKDADVQHDFFKDPIKLQQQGEWLSVSDDLQRRQGDLFILWDLRGLGQADRRNRMRG